MGNTVWLVIGGVILASFLLSFILSKMFGKVWALLPSGILLVLTIVFVVLIAIPEGDGSWADLGFIILALVTGVSFIITSALTFAFILKVNKS